MRVLLLAEVCNPQWVSVPLVGWSHAAALRKIFDVHLVTQVRNAAAIEAAGLRRDVDFTAIDTEALAAPANKLAGMLGGGGGKGWTTLAAINALTYPLFERLIWKKFKQRIAAREFDIVHRLTPLTPTAASSLAGRCRKAGVPFVLGPLNGGVPWPKQFDSARRKEKEWLSYVRGMYRLLPGYRSTRENAAAIMIGSRDTWEQLPQRYHGKAFYVPENAIDPAKFPEPAPRPADGPLRAIFVGRLVPYKGADMLLEAAAPLVRSGRLRVTIAGDGPQLAELRTMVARENLGDGVELSGWVDHAVVAAKMAAADVLAFPSVREFGGGVVLEAMAAGVVPIVVDYGGPAELVTAATGFTVPIGSRESIAAGFARRLEMLCDPGQRTAVLPAMAASARRRAVEQFSWEAKARQTAAVYEWTHGGPRPDFPMPTPDPGPVGPATGTVWMQDA